MCVVTQIYMKHIWSIKITVDVDKCHMDVPMNPCNNYRLLASRQQNLAWYKIRSLINSSIIFITNINLQLNRC